MIKMVASRLCAISFIFLVVLLNFSVIICDDDVKFSEKATEESIKKDAAEGLIPAQEDDVHVLTDDNFDKFVMPQKFVLVEFYAPWCGHCKQLAPEYAKAAKELKNNDPSVPLAKVDCTVQTKLADRFEIQGYPTIKLFKDGKETDYEGPRDGPGIVKYLKEQTDPNYVPPPDAVVTLTEKNFKEITDREEIMLVEFYAPWCGHCKKIAPELEKAAVALQTDEKPILIGKVDATVEKQLATDHGVTGYPTMKIFRKGVPSDYKGPREEPGISKHMREQSGDPTTLYETLSDVKKYLKSNFDEPVIIGVFENENEPLYKLFLSANNDVRSDYSFGHTFAKEAKSFFDLKKSAIVIAHPTYLLTKHEPIYRVYDDASGSNEDVLKFYKNHHVPLIGHMQQHTEKRFWKRPLVVVFYDVNFEPETRSLTEYWRQKIVPFALKYPDAQFAVADESNFQHKLQELGLSDSGEDVNVGIYKQNGQRFALDDEFNEENLDEFLDDFYHDKLKPVIKSKPIPRKAKPGKVQEVVGKSFEDVVLNEKKEVFIEFYAPWCGHCKKLAPVIDQLAKKFKNEDSIVIAKIDATENEAPDPYTASGYPTIYYTVPGSKDKPIKFEGAGRELKDLVKFVEDNSIILKKKKEEL